VLFKPLTLPEIERIVDLMFNDLRAGLADRQMTLEISQGARIGRALVASDVRDGALIRVGMADGELTVTYENPA
jgi:ATP-dependent Clp protease ATP-binding subunit ClpB